MWAYGNIYYVDKEACECQTTYDNEITYLFMHGNQSSA